MKSYDVTIQIQSSRPVLSHDAVCLSKNLENEMWKFARNLPLATLGSERVNGATLRQGLNSYFPMAAGN